MKYKTNVYMDIYSSLGKKNLVTKEISDKIYEYIRQEVEIKFVKLSKIPFNNTIDKLIFNLRDTKKLALNFIEKNTPYSMVANKEYDVVFDYSLKNIDDIVSFLNLPYTMVNNKSEIIHLIYIALSNEEKQRTIRSIDDIHKLFVDVLIHRSPHLHSIFYETLQEKFLKLITNIFTKYLK